MNDSQSTAGSDSSQFGPTRNPQTTPTGQNLAGSSPSLQTSTPNLFTGNNNVSITSVGDTSFTPYTPDNSTQATTTSPAPKQTNHHYPVIIGSGVLIIAILVVSWLMMRKQASY